MELKLTVHASASIKRKKPWPKLAWLGKDHSGLYLLDKSRVSQLFLPSGKTRKKIPSLQPFLIDVQALSTSSNGAFLVGALRSGKVFVWNRDTDSLHTTPVLDKIRNVLGSNNKAVHLFISNSGTKILLLSSLDHLFLWETEGDAFPSAPGEPFTGTWVQIQSGEYLLPSDKDKERAINGIFYDDQVCGQCAMVSWVFNKGDKMHITTIQLQWPQSSGNFGIEHITESNEGTSNLRDVNGSSLSFTAKWHTFVHPLHSLTPANRVLKSSKAYVACFSNDGKVLAVAMNQKVAADARMMFYSTAGSSVAIVTDLKGCGSVSNVQVNGKLWWIADMSWTRDSLLLVSITRCGSLAILTKLGEPVLTSTEGCSVDMGPNFYLPLHPRISFRKPTIHGESDSSMSSSSDTDVLRQKFSVAVHPNLPVILTSDGYLVTVLQLPGNASYKGAILSLITSISRLVPEVELDQNIEQLSCYTSHVNLFQFDSNLSRVQSVEEMSENTLSSSSSLAGYGLASGDQGMAFMPIITPEQYSSPPEHQDKRWKFVEAQTISLKALALGTSAGPNWTKDISSVLYSVIRVVVKLFSMLLRDHESLEGNLTSSLKMFSRTIEELQTGHRVPLDSQAQRLEDCFTYFKMAMQLFQWDCKNRNAFSLALRLVHGVIKEVLGCRQFSDVLKISSSIQFLEFSEDLLDSVYSWKLSSKPVGSKGLVVDRFSPTKGIPANPNDVKKSDQLESSVSEESEGLSKNKSQVAGSLSAPWLILYNYTAQSCKRSSKQRRNIDDEVDGSLDTLTQLLCDIQKNLQDAGVVIPSTGPAKADHVSAVASLVELNQDDVAIGLLADSPGDSLFGRRRRTNRGFETPKQSTPTKLRKASSLDCLLGASSIKSPHLRRGINIPDPVSAVTINDKTTETLLAILYVNLQQYNLRSALELVFSLMEPPLEHFDSSLSSIFRPIDIFHASGGQDYTTNQILSVLLQPFPILRVADKCGVPVLQTIGRFMAAYFSNLPLYIFPSYHPESLPPFYMGEASKLDSNSDESFALSQGVEVLHLDRERVSAAAREQGISDIWSANNALEFMLVSGLIGEAAWLANNLGDWKHAFLLSAAHTIITKYSQPENLPSTLLPSLPHDITPEKIVLARLQPIFHSPQSTLPIIQKIPVEISDDVTSTPTKDRLMVDEPKPDKLELEIDDKLVKDVGKMLQASVVAGLDIVPIMMWGMLLDLLGLVSKMEWIVPEELYLPAPPLFCPQPPSTEKEFLLPRVYRERQLRSEIAVLVQKLLTLLHSSNCMAACIQWYVQELIIANEKWYSIPKDDQDFVLPQSLMNHSEMTGTFTTAEESLVRAVKRTSPKSKGKPSPSRSSIIHSSSVSVVLACSQQFCFVMWMLHARDKMSLCARKYRRARHKAENNPQTAHLIEGLCWETLQWTLALQPFSSFLGAQSQVTDTLLTLLSEMQPSIASAEITARHFPDPNLVPSTSGRAKFKRLMTQFRGITLQEAGSIDQDNSDEPLSVFYRIKCVEWEDELKERHQLYNNVQMEVFPLANNEDEFTPIKNNSKILFCTSKSLPNVGATIFETTQSYLDFLDTFFLITFTKTASQSSEQVMTNSVPLLLPYEKLFTLSENKVLKEFKIKVSADKRKMISVGTSLSRSQSYSDIRSSKPSSKLPFGRDEYLGGGQTDIRRTNSMNDISKATSHSGIVVLGNEIIEMLPNLVWLSRWSSEGSFLPSSSNIDKDATRTNDVLPVMKVNVELPMLVNSWWLLKNIYGPWELNQHVNPEFLKQVPKPVAHASLVEAECLAQEKPSLSNQGFTADWPSGTLLRRASSDTDIPRIMVQSPTTEEESHERKETMDGVRKTRTRHEKRLEAAETIHHSDTESALPCPIQDKTPLREKRSRKKSKSTKRSLNLDAQVEDIVVGVQVVSTPEKEIKDKSMLTKTHKHYVNVKPNEQASFTGQNTTDMATDGRPITFRSDSHVTSPILPDHEADLCHSHLGRISPPTEPTYPPKPAGTPGPSVQDATSNVFAEQGLIDRSRDALPRNSTSQSVTGGVELLLVLRPPAMGNQTDGATTTTHVPLLKLSTMTSGPINASTNAAKTSIDNAANFRTKIKEVASQTEPTVNTSVSTDTDNFSRLTDRPEKNVISQAVDFSAQYNESRDAGCQTAFSPNPSDLLSQGTAGGRKGQSHDEMHLDSNNGQEQLPRFAWPERKNANSFNAPFQLLRLGQQPISDHENCFNVIPPMNMFREYPQGKSIEDKPSFPLLHVPKQAPVHQSNPRTFRLFQVPPEARSLPLLQFPASQDKTQTKPDLSKIKFLDVSRNNDPFTLLEKEESKSVRGAQNLLLHMPVKQSRTRDFKSLAIEEDFRKQVPMPLLRRPEKKSKPKLVPADELAAFEKKRKRKEESLRYSTREKENIQPKRKQEERRYKSSREKNEKRPDEKDRRQTISRQRRRDHVRKDTEDAVQPRQLFVLPAQRTKPSKATHMKDTTAQSSGVTLDEGLSEESELELSDISENFDLSEEEQLYFNIPNTPKATDPQVDQYCRALEDKVKKQFDKELEQRRKEEMDKEVKEQVRKEMKKAREEEEVRKRVREELALQERMEQQARAREMALAARHEEQHKATYTLEEIKENDRPVPRKRSVKHEQSTNVHFEDDSFKKTRAKLKQNSVEAQVEDEDFPRPTSSQGNQTEPLRERSEDLGLDKPKSFAPVLPPDIFMGLTFHRDQSHDTDDEADERKAPDVDKESANQFISVADIDSRLWGTVKDSAMVTEICEKEEEHVIDDADEILSDDDEQHTDTKESSTGRQSSRRPGKHPKKYDSLTVKMMDSTDIPRQRMHTARTVSKERMSNRLEEMTQQLDAMEQITQNMDREFKSSNVLLDAIDSIGDIMTPPAAKESTDHTNRHVTSSRRHQRSPERSQRVRDTTPWRRGKEVPVYRKEDTPSSPDNVSLDGTSDEAELEKPDVVQKHEAKVSFKDEEQISEKNSSVENDLSQEFENTESIDEDLDITPTKQPSRDREESRDLEESRDQDESRDLGESRDQEEARDIIDGKQPNNNDRLGDVASSIVSRQSNSDSFQDMPNLSSETLKEIFSDNRDSSRREIDNQRSLEKRKKIQDWMVKKRTERHAAWKSEVDELRISEFKPFTTATEGPSSLKKIKLAEKDRVTERRKREDTYTDERMKAASNLLNEMLAEHVPKADTLQNLRYAPPSRAHKEKPASKPNNRYNKKTKPVHLSSKDKPRSDVARLDAVEHRDPELEMYGIRKGGLSTLGLDNTPHTSSPIYTNIDNQYDETEANRYGLGRKEDVRSVTPSGADFITMKTYRMHEKDKLRRSEEFENERQLKTSQTDEYEPRRMDFTGLYRSGSSIDIDNLMEQIPDGSTMDEDRLQDINSLLSDDSELKELLSDVIGSNMKFDRKRGVLKRDSTKRGVTRPIGLGTVTLGKGPKQDARKTTSMSSNKKPVRTRQAPQAGRLKDRATTSIQTKPRGQSTTTTSKTGLGRGRGRAGSLGNLVANGPGTTARSGLSRGRGKDFGKEVSKEGKRPKDSKKPLIDIDDVSPWNTGDSLKMSDDVAQLLAEAKQAIGDDVSESSGSIMSNIDWDAVDRIMNDL